MVKRFLKLSEVPQADSADALACAMCHANAYNQLQSMDALSYRMKKVGSYDRQNFRHSFR